MTFNVTYRHNGKEHSFDVPGETAEEAAEHIRSAFYNGQIVQIVTRIPAPSVLGKAIERFK